MVYWHYFLLNVDWGNSLEGEDGEGVDQEDLNIDYLQNIRKEKFLQNDQIILRKDSSL
jgi:hypothetical protein